MTGSKCASGLKLRLSSSSGSRTDPLDVLFAAAGSTGVADVVAAAAAAAAVVVVVGVVANENENRECDCVAPSANDTDDVGGPVPPLPLPLLPPLNENDANGVGFAAAKSDVFDVSVVVFCVSFVDFTKGDEIGVDDAGFVMPLPKIDFCAPTDGTTGDAVADAAEDAAGFVITYECGGTANSC